MRPPSAAISEPLSPQRAACPHAQRAVHPRPGHAVWVGFLDGDIAPPLVIGSQYHGVADVGDAACSLLWFSPAKTTLNSEASDTPLDTRAKASDQSALDSSRRPAYCSPYKASAKLRDWNPPQRYQAVCAAITHARSLGLSALGDYVLMTLLHRQYPPSAWESAACQAGLAPVQAGAQSLSELVTHMEAADAA